MPGLAELRFFGRHFKAAQGKFDTRKQGFEGTVRRINPKRDWALKVPQKKQ